MALLAEMGAAAVPRDRLSSRAALRAFESAGRFREAGAVLRLLDGWLEPAAHARVSVCVCVFCWMESF